MKREILVMLAIVGLAGVILGRVLNLSAWVGVAVTFGGLLACGVVWLLGIRDKSNSD